MNLGYIQRNNHKEMLVDLMMQHLSLQVTLPAVAVAVLVNLVVMVRKILTVQQRYMLVLEVLASRRRHQEEEEGREAPPPAPPRW